MKTIGIISFSFFTLICLGGCFPIAIVGGGTQAALSGADPRNIDGVVSDRSLKTRIQANWARSKTDLAMALDATVFEGRVLLTGNVKRAELRAEAVALAWEVEGVKEILDHITTDAEEGPGVYASDTYLLAKVRTKMLFEDGVKANNYKLKVQNGSVYIMGVATSQEELEKVAHIAQNSGGASKIISYVRIDPNLLKPKDDQAPKASSEEETPQA